MIAAHGSYLLDALERPGTERHRLGLQARQMWSEESVLLRRAGLRPGARVMDLGCGTGEISRLLAAEVGDGPVVGVDADPDILPAHTS
jgi:ubiquinone/menaquinone biosynthesis C-methylase UbiE